MRQNRECRHEIEFSSANTRTDVQSEVHKGQTIYRKMLIYVCATNVSCVHSFDLNQTTVLLQGY
jgi:hypothetical protein